MNEMQKIPFQNVMISKMIDLAEGGQKLPEDWSYRYHQELRLPWEKAVNNGTMRKEILDFFDCEALGNQCPVCGRYPELVETPIRFGENELGYHRFHVLSCNCEEEFLEEVQKEEELKKRIMAADIPTSFVGASWGAWDQTVDPKLSESFRKVQGLAYGDNINNLIVKGLGIFGGVGRGKTMAGICVLRTILENTSKKCKYIPMVDFTRNIMRAGQDGNYLDQLDEFDVLFLDDLDKLSSSSLWVQERVFSLFDSMFRGDKCLIFTTNKPNFVELQNHFGEHGEAIVSRMTGKMEYAMFNGGEDYRKMSRIRELKAEKSGVSG